MERFVDLLAALLSNECLVQQTLPFGPVLVTLIDEAPGLAAELVRYWG